MNLDIVFVTYNSAKWIEKCFESLNSSIYNLKNISIFVVDNKSTDNSVNILNTCKDRYAGSFKDFTIIEMDKNRGFGIGNNAGFKVGKSEFVFFLNVDTELDKNAFIEVEKAISKSPQNTAVWELRQFPYEHPKLYDPLTFETSWVSGAAFIIKREIFAKLKGFDENIFMYAEDVDLSWRVKERGFSLLYVPSAIVNHYSYTSAGEIKPNQYIYSILNNYLLRLKHGSIFDILAWHVMFLIVFFKKEPFKKSKSKLLLSYIESFVSFCKALSWRIINVLRMKKFNPKFLKWDYELIREGSFYFNQQPKQNQKVSVVIRTCGRPDVLREALVSVRNQTYTNIETIVVEDGLAVSEDMIKKEFSDLNIVYRATGEKVGRCRVGNIGVELAGGKYINFLDDDDVFFADHIEVLVSTLENNQNYKLAYSLSFQSAIEKISDKPYKYITKKYSLPYNQSFNRMMLFQKNYVPILCMLFEKSLYIENGGFDETIEILEDWDLWLKYSLANDFYFVNKITSMYRVPAKRSEFMNRPQALSDNIHLKMQRNKQKKYFSNVNVFISAMEIDEIVKKAVPYTYMTVLKAAVKLTLLKLGLRKK